MASMFCLKEGYLMRTFAKISKGLSIAGACALLFTAACSDDPVEHKHDAGSVDATAVDAGEPDAIEVDAGPTAEAINGFVFVGDTVALVPAFQLAATPGPDFLRGTTVTVDFDSHDPTVAAPPTTGCTFTVWDKETPPANTNVDAKVAVSISGLATSPFPDCSFVSTEVGYRCLGGAGLLPEDASVIYAFEKANPTCTDTMSEPCLRLPMAYISLLGVELK
jgi:hypothetical protein